MFAEAMESTRAQRYSPVNIPTIEEETSSLVNDRAEQHGRDSAIDPQLGRYRSLRIPSEFYYDNPTYDALTGFRADASSAGKQSFEESFSSSTLKQDSSTLQNTPEQSRYTSATQMPKYPSSVYDDDYVVEGAKTPTSFTMHGARSPASSFEQPRMKFPPAADTAYQGAHGDGYQPVGSSRPTALPQRLWQSHWLKKSTLLLICLFFLAIMIALLVLRFKTSASYAIASPSTSSYYASILVPPAVMIIVISLWRQVDYNVKLIAPWRELRAGPTDPQRSLMVDYITPLKVQSLFAAMGCGHMTVVISSLAFTITKVLLILSTALFATRVTPMMDDFPTISSVKFDASSASRSAGLEENDYSSRPLYRYLTNMTNDLPLPKGTTKDFAYIPLTLHSDSIPVPDFDFFRATTDAFLPQVTCTAINVTTETPSLIRPTNISYNSTDVPYGTNPDISFSLPGNRNCSSWKNVSVSAFDPLHYRTAKDQITGTLQEVFCDNSAEVTGLLYTLTQIQYSQDLLTNVSRPEGGPLPIALNTSREVINIMNILCQVSHQISSANITETAFAANNSVQLRDDANNTKLADLSDRNMASIFRKAVASATGYFQIPTNQSTLPVVRSPAFDLLTITAGAKQYDELFDPNRARVAAEKMFRGVMVQYAFANLTSSIAESEASKDSPAFVVWSEEKLCLNPVTVFVLVALLGILVLMTSALVFMSTNEVVPQDPSTIAANATILARSPGLNRILRKQYAPGQQNTTALLSNKTFATAIANTESGMSSFKIIANTESTHSAPGSVQKDIKWWRPLGSDLLSLFLAVICLIIAIVLLEVFQVRSNADNGLSSTRNDLSTFLASHLVTAVVVLILISLTNTLSFNVALFAPWIALSKGNQSADRSILLNLTAHYPVIASFKAIQKRHFAAFLAMIASAAATLMIVFVPNLYTIRNIVSDGALRELNNLDTWNLSAVYSVTDDKGAATVLNLIKYDNSSFPTNTWEEFAWPRLSQGEYNTEDPFAMMFAETSVATVPALRGNLGCDMPSNIQTQAVDQSVLVAVDYPLPRSCHLAGAQNDSSRILIQTNFSSQSNGDTFAGRLLDLRFGSNANVHGNVGEDFSDQVGDNPAVGCPSLAIFFGDLQQKMTIAVCYQKVQELQLNLTFAPNSAMIDTKNPPVSNETSVKDLQNPQGSQYTEVFDFRIQNNINRLFEATNSSNTSNVDGFFETLTSGKNAVDITILKDIAKRDEALQAINGLYRRYMAQVYNAIMRQPLDNPSKPRLLARQTSNASYDMQTRFREPRLFQNNNSKLAVQILLGITVLLLVIAYLLSGLYRGILPCTPSSIAGCMSLLAGSDLVWTKDDSICDCCGKRRRSSIGTPDHMSDGHSAETRSAFDNRKQIIPANTEWMDKRDFWRVFQVHRYRSDWWQEDVMLGKNKRFGIDICDASRQQNRDEEWHLGKRGSASEGSRLSNFLQAAKMKMPAAYTGSASRGSYQRANPHSNTIADDPVNQTWDSSHHAEQGFEMDGLGLRRPEQSGWDPSVTRGLRGEWSRIDASQESLRRG